MRLLPRLLTAGIGAALIGLSGCISSGSAVSGKAGGIGPLALGQTGSSRGAALTATLDGGLVSDIPDLKLASADRRLALNAEYKALEYTDAGQTVTWQSEDGKQHGDIVPGQPYRVGSQDCRQYTHTVVLNGEPHVARGAACRNEDGSWTRLT